VSPLLPWCLCCSAALSGTGDFAPTGQFAPYRSEMLKAYLTFYPTFYYSHEMDAGYTALMANPSAVRLAHSKCRLASRRAPSHCTALWGLIPQPLEGVLLAQCIMHGMHDTESTACTQQQDGSDPQAQLKPSQNTSQFDCCVCLSHSNQQKPSASRLHLKSLSINML
jgi:hypothetical protein